MLYGILGLPRSGTTIVCSAFNSAKQSVCLCEPHWFLLGLDRTKAGKVDHRHAFGQTNITCKAPNEIYPALADYLRRTGRTHGGVKETYRSWQQGAADFVFNKRDLGLIVAVHREPVSCFKSWISVFNSERWGYPYNQEVVFADSYRSFISRLKQAPQRVVHLKLESLQQGGINYLTSKVRAIAPKFEFSPSFAPMEDFTFGDGQAKRSTGITKTATKAIMVSERKLAIVKRLIPLYDNL